jgi:hypothetical protein
MKRQTQKTTEGRRNRATVVAAVAASAILNIVACGLAVLLIGGIWGRIQDPATTFSSLQALGAVILLTSPALLLTASRRLILNLRAQLAALT